jgi:putative phosphoribosyl transferase
MSAETDKLQTGLITREIRIPAGTSALPGELTVPPDPQGFILFAHGSGGSWRSASDQFLASEFQKKGLGTLLFDLLTAEEAAEEDIRGHLGLNIGLLKQRLATAAHWVADEDEARHLRLGVIGTGTGGAAGLVAAADLAAGIGAVVCAGGRPDLAGNALLRAKAPTLLVVGGQDESLLEFNEDAYEMLDCEKSLVVIPDGTSCFNEPATLTGVAGAATEWFLKHLRAFPSARYTR